MPFTFNWPALGLIKSISTVKLPLLGFLLAFLNLVCTVSERFLRRKRYKAIPVIAEIARAV